MNSKQQKLFKIVYPCTVNLPEKTEEKINGVLLNIKNTIIPFYAESYDDEDYAVIKDEILQRLVTTMLPGIELLDEYHYERWWKSRLADLEDPYHWDNYKQYLLNEKGFGNNVVKTLDKELDDLTDFLGDPMSDVPFQRRGLVIGNIQSGKTATYLGLINKAADAGYEVFIILTGTIEKLRQQTQKRIDEGFIGFESRNAFSKDYGKRIGVGIYFKNDSQRPMNCTSTISDFDSLTGISMDLSSVKVPKIFVLKKNVKVLQKLKTWLGKNMSDPMSQPLLLIDDEADYASINTNKDDEDPTKTNRNIRDILNLFKKASYLGFTATPFANIFINPDIENDESGDDLFPRNYIYSLNEPSNYIGPKQIFDQNSSLKGMIQKIDVEDIEEEDCLPMKHKKEHLPSRLPEDLKKAVRTFFISNAIRDLRPGQDKTHRSMLINVSRFTEVQNNLYGLIDDYVNQLIYTLKSARTPKNDPIWNDLKTTFEDVYVDVKNISWRDIAPKLLHSNKVVETLVINQSSKKDLDYDLYKTSGRRVIVIGGLTLSRGLTLEGLTVSYFYRNSRNYDTLMQMGRWFGYRDHYQDLCRIWLSPDSIEWYKEISTATEELLESIEELNEKGSTPEEFGLMVRESETGLLVTALNKMRSTDSCVLKVSASGVPIETPYLSAKVSQNQYNFDQILEFIERQKRAFDEFRISRTRTYGYRNIPKSEIIDLLSKLNVAFRIGFTSENIIDFLNESKEPELENWDIVFIQGDGDEETRIDFNGVSLKKPTRQYSYDKKKELITINGSKARLGAKDDFRFSLTQEQYNSLKRKKKNISDKDYLDKIDNSSSRRPVLNIYLLQLTKEISSAGSMNTGIEKLIQERFKKLPVVGLSLGIPKLNDSDNEKITYRINRTKFKQLHPEFFEDE